MSNQATKGRSEGPFFGEKWELAGGWRRRVRTLPGPAGNQSSSRVGVWVQARPLRIKPAGGECQLARAERKASRAGASGTIQNSQDQVAGQLWIHLRPGTHQIGLVHQIANFQLNGRKWRIAVHSKALACKEVEHQRLEAALILWLTAPPRKLIPRPHPAFAGKRYRTKPAGRGGGCRCE